MNKSFSKVNLILKIYPKKNNDVKHKIKSLFILNKKIYDVISINESKKASILYQSDNKKINIYNCLIKKTLKYLEKNFNIKKKYSIKIKKNIKFMSGLGGGSSNAAFVIKKILDLNKISLSKLNYKDIAINLGSDIPFFLSGYECAIVYEYGNKIKPIFNFPDIKYKILINKFESSTKKIFQNLNNDKKYISKVNFSKCYKNMFNQKFNQSYTYNDLQLYVLKLFPILNKDLKKTIVCGAGSSLIKFKDEK